MEFVEAVFLPTAEKRLKRSTHRNYKGDWERRVKPLVRRKRKNLKDFKTYDVQRLLNQIGQDKTLSKNSLCGIKAFISGVFKEARRLGYFTNENPVRDTRVPDARGPEQTYGQTLEEIQAMLECLPEPGATIFAIAAYAGLHRGEIEALRWEDYFDGALHVARSIVNGEITTPKSKAAKRRSSHSSIARAFGHAPARLWRAKRRLDVLDRQQDPALAPERGQPADPSGA